MPSLLDVNSGQTPSSAFARLHRAAMVGMFVLLQSWSSQASETQLLRKAEMLNVDYKALDREMYRKNKVLSNRSSSKHVTSRPHFAVVVVPFTTEHCGVPEILSWFDFNGQRAESDFLEASSRLLDDGVCRFSGGDQQANVAGSYLWIRSALRSGSSKMSRKQADWLQSLTSDLLIRDQPLSIDAIESKIDQCTYDCSPHPAYLVSLMFAAADAYDLSGRVEEGSAWRDLALLYAKDLPFFIRRASAVVRAHVNSDISHSLSIGDIDGAEDRLADYDAFFKEHADDRSSLRSLVESAGKKTPTETPRTLTVKLHTSHPLGLRTGTAFTSRVGGSYFELDLLSGELSYAFLLCAGNTYPLGALRKLRWELPKNSEGNHIADSCSLLAYGEAGSLLEFRGFYR